MKTVILVFLALVLTLFTTTLQASKTTEVETRIKIGIIDTGLDMEYLTPDGKKILCKDGHKSLVDDIPLTDSHGHGTNIFSLVTRDLDSSKFCVIVVKFFEPAKSVDFLRASIKALRHLQKYDIKYLNLSYGGTESSYEEKQEIQKFLDKKIRVAAAAGNEYADLDKGCTYYPACYKFHENSDYFDVVGNSGSGSSNRGKVVEFWYNGVNKGVPMMSGTSQSTAIHLNLRIIGDSL